MTLRQLLAVLLLPVNVTVVIPALLWSRRGWAFPMAAVPWGWGLQALGAILLGTGLLWFASSLWRFATEGKGTLAPWDPPRELVVSGLYRYVRNPMITGVALVLLGEAALLVSPVHLGWALTFIGANVVMIPLYEEPRLRRRFGDAYIEYCAHVPRLIPRTTPWQSPGRKSPA